MTDSSTFEQFHVIINAPYPRPEITNKGHDWSSQDDDTLLKLSNQYEDFSVVDWTDVSCKMNISEKDCMQRAIILMQKQLRRQSLGISRSESNNSLSELSQAKIDQLNQCVLKNDFDWGEIGEELGKPAQKCRELYLQCRNLATPFLESDDASSPLNSELSPAFLGELQSLAISVDNNGNSSGEDDMEPQLAFVTPILPKKQFNKTQGINEKVKDISSVNHTHNSAQSSGSSSISDMETLTTTDSSISKSALEDAILSMVDE